MPRVMRPASVIGRAIEHFPAWLRQSKHAESLDLWATGRQVATDNLYMPKDQTIGDEYKDLANRSPNPWLMLIINALQQTIFLDGVRMPGEADNLEVYSLWQQNGMDSKQGPLYRASMGQGVAYVIALPGRDRLTGGRTSVWTPRSAIRVSAFFDDTDDEWPYLALDAVKQKWESTRGGVYEDGYAVQLIDETAVHYLSCRGEGLERADWTYNDYEEHGQPVVPVVDYPNMTDLDGRAMGEVEPFIPLARRLDQDVFDRLIVQRFGAWKVRYITGLVRPQGMTDDQYRADLLKLKVGDFLVAESDKTKIGTIDETQLDGFIKAGDADLRTLSAVSQTPPHHMLGIAPQMQPEALAAAEGGFRAKGTERKTTWGERHERLFRLGAYQIGNTAEARAFDMQVRWRDMETRSLSQAADALGKLATQVGVPQEMLFEKIPGWTDYDVQRAKELVESGVVDQLIAELAAQQGRQAISTGAPASAGV